MKVESEVLRRLGPIPFWRGETRCLDEFARIWQKAAEAAERIRRGEREAECRCRGD